MKKLIYIFIFLGFQFDFRLNLLCVGIWQIVKAGNFILDLPIVIFLLRRANEQRFDVLAIDAREPDLEFLEVISFGAHYEFHAGVIVRRVKVHKFKNRQRNESIKEDLE